MAEELRFFVRVGLFTIVIGTIYWFVSYEEAGSILLAGIVGSVVSFASFVAVNVRGARQGGRKVNDLLGFSDAGADGPLGLEEDTFPLSSAWPVVASVAAALVGAGLIYGAWLWVPGGALGLAAACGWLSETSSTGPG